MTDHETSNPSPLLDAGMFWERNKSPILAVLAVLVLAGLGYGGYQLYQEYRGASAARALAGAQLPADYLRVMDDYAGTGPAANAHLLLAERQREEKKFADSNATLEKFLERYPEHQFTSTARLGLAANLDAMGETEKALAALQRLTSEHPQDFNTPVALLTQVQLLRALGRLEEARRVTETILSQHADSLVANEARRQLRTLPPPTAPAKPAATAPVTGTPAATPPRRRCSRRNLRRRTLSPQAKERWRNRVPLRKKSAGSAASSASRTGSACERRVVPTSCALSSAGRG